MSNAAQSKISLVGALLNLVGCLAVLAGAAAAVWWIYRTEPTAQQINTKRKSAAIVETIVVARGDYSPQLSVLGTVRPAQEIVLSPRVRGEVIELSTSLVPGAMVKAGELLLKIDPADFENALSIRQSELEQVQATWEIEQGRQTLARQELNLLGDSIEGINRSLVLREPQAASLKSQLHAAEAAVERAKLELERTSLSAPFDAQVISRSVNIGSQVQPGDELAQLVGISQYWVLAAVPVRHLRWLRFAEDGREGSVAMLSDSDAWGKGVEREGQLRRLIGALDTETRLARVLITVDDPLGKQSDAPPLILDSLVDVAIAARAIPSCVRLPREHVHDGDTVWVMKDGLLEIRQADVEFRDPKFAYIVDGLETGDEIVTTTLATVADGVKLRKAPLPDAALTSLSSSGQRNESPSPGSGRGNESPAPGNAPRLSGNQPDNEPPTPNTELAESPPHEIQLTNSLRDQNLRPKNPATATAEQRAASAESAQ